MMSSRENAQSDGAGFKGMRRHARSTRDVVNRHVTQEQGTRELLGKPWDGFIEDAEQYLNIFEEFFPGIINDIHRKLESQRSMTGRAVLFDLTGIADGRSIGATESIGMTLTPEGIEPKPGQKILIGNLLTHKGLELTTGAIAKAGSRVNLFIMRPVAAVDNHRRNPYSYRKASRVLLAAYNALGPNDEILIDLRRIPAQTEDIRPALEEMFRGTGVHILQGGRLENGLETKLNIFRIIKD